MSPGYLIFLQGVAATGAWASGFFFFRFWRQSHDRLFGFFALAFWLLALSWLLLATVNPTEETQPYIYALRLLAFLLIIGGIVDKNRGSARA
jgi:hypothetical protein